MRKSEAEKLFLQYHPHVKQWPDKHKQRLVWDMFTDALCKDGQITQKQYDTWNRPRFIK